MLLFDEKEKVFPENSSSKDDSCNKEAGKYNVREIKEITLDSIALDAALSTFQLDDMCCFHFCYVVSV